LGEDRIDSIHLLPDLEVDTLVSTEVAQIPSMVLRRPDHYSHILVGADDHHKNRLLHVMMVALLVDRDEVLHEKMRHHHDCQNYLFQLGLESRLERGAQIR